MVWCININHLFTIFLNVLIWNNITLRGIFKDKYKWIFFSKFCESKLLWRPNTSKYFSAFPTRKDVLLYNHNILTNVKRLVIIHCDHLNFRFISNLANCPNTVLFRKLYILSRNCFAFGWNLYFLQYKIVAQSLLEFYDAFSFDSYSPTILKNDTQLRSVWCFLKSTKSVRGNMLCPSPCIPSTSLQFQFVLILMMLMFIPQFSLWLSESFSILKLLFYPIIIKNILYKDVLRLHEGAPHQYPLLCTDALVTLLGSSILGLGHNHQPPIICFWWAWSQVFCVFV